MKSVMWSLFKILAAGVFIGLAVKLLPIVDILYIFLMCFVIPLTMILSLGIISEETYNLLSGPFKALYAELYERAQARAEELRAEEMAA